MKLKFEIMFEVKDEIDVSKKAIIKSTLNHLLRNVVLRTSGVIRVGVSEITEE